MHLVQLRGIADHEERRCRQLRLELDARTQRAAHELQCLGHDAVELHRSALAALAAAVVKDLLDQRARAVGGGEHVLRVAPVRRAGLRALGQQLRIAEDPAEDVVEVVRDTSGEPSDCFHFLGLAQPLSEPRTLGLRVLALGDVTVGFQDEPMAASPRASAHGGFRR